LGEVEVGHENQEERKKKLEVIKGKISRKERKGKERKRKKRKEKKRKEKKRKEKKREE